MLGEEKGTVNVEDLRVVLLILIGVKSTDREKRPENEPDASGPAEGEEIEERPNSFFEEGKLYIR